MAKQDLTLELFYGGAWNAAPAYARNTIAISRGAGAEGQEAPPSEASATLDNTSKDYNPRNPTGALYGAAGRNTPMRIAVDAVVRSTVEAATWAPQQSPDTDPVTGEPNDRWTDIVGGGIMRRLGQGDTPLRSPAYRALTAPANDANLIEYVPLEEEQSATSVTAWRGSRVVVDGAVQFGGFTASASSERLATLGDAGKVIVDVPEYNSSEHKVINLCRIPDTGLTDLAIMLRIDCAGGTIDHIDMKWSTGNGIRMEFYSGDSIVDTFGPVNWNASIANGDEFFSSVELTQDGADIDVLHLIVGVPTGNAGLVTDTVVGHTIGRVFRLTYGYDNVSGMSVGHIGVGNDTGAFPNYISPVNDSLGTQGFSGELAGLRAIRLGDEEGVTVTIVGDENDTEPMGPQPALPFLDLIAECVRTDDGLLFEPIDALELAIRPGRSLYNQTEVLTLDFDDECVSHPLAPDIGDKFTRNDVTAKRRSGGQYRATKTTGPLNTSNPIDDPEGVGKYDVGVDVNTETDARLEHHAHWHLHRGTVDEPRYPALTVELTDADPAFVSTVEGVDIGDRIVVENLPDDWQQGPASLVVLGIREDIPTHERRVTFNTIPASQFEIGIVAAEDGSVAVRGQAVDTDLSTTAAAVSNSATSFGVNTVGDLEWTTNPDDWDTGLHGDGVFGPGLFIIIGGEVMRITSITGTGGGTQTFNVVRSVNGVVKSHADASPVHVYQPIVVGK